MAPAALIRRSAPGVPTPQTVVVMGDSLTEQGGFNTSLPGGYATLGTHPQFLDTSYWTWANVLLGWRFSVLRNAGIFGQTTAQILARLEQDVISLRPGWVWLLAGTNDVGKGILETQTKPNLRAILDRCQQAGIRVAWLTIPPRIGTSYTGTTKQDTLALNDWIRGEARTRGNVVLCDVFPALAGGGANYLATVYGFNPTSDGVHMAGAGGFAAGQVVANALAPESLPVDAFYDTTASRNLLPDPRFANGGSGSAPTNWTAANVPTGTTYTKTARTDQPWSWQTITVPAGATQQFSLQGSSGADASGRSASGLVGLQVVGTVEFQASGLDQAAAAGAQGLYLSCDFWNGSTWTRNYAMQNTSGPNGTRSGRLMTHALTVPPGTTTIGLFLWMLGGGTFNFDRAGIYVVGSSVDGLTLP